MKKNTGTKTKKQLLDELETLREHNALYRSFAANLPGGAVFIMDSELRYVVADGPALGPAGFIPASFEGKTIWEAVDLETAGDYEPFLRRALEGEPFKRQHFSHGRRFMSHGLPLRNAEGAVTHILILSYDITEQKEAERKLAEQAFMFSNISDALIGFDMNYRITYWSPSAARMFGYTEAEALGRPGFEVLRPESIGRTQEEVRRRLAEDGYLEAEFIEYTRDGRALHIDSRTRVIRNDKGEPSGMIAVNRDVTDRKRAEEVLRDVERKYGELIRHAPSGIYEIDFRKKRFTSVNDAMSRMLGYSHEELLAMNPFDVIDEEGKARFQDRIARWLKGEEPERNVEYKVKTKDGRMLDVVLNVSFTADKNGEPLGARVIAHDVTSLKEAEAALHRKSKMLQSIFDSIPVLLVMWDPRLNRFALNLHAEEVLGWATADANEGDFMRKVYPDAAYRGLVAEYMQSLEGRLARMALQH